MREICFLFLLLLPASGLAESPKTEDVFQAGIYTDDSRTMSCISGPAGTEFEFSVWAWVPEDLGTAYITLRFGFPENVGWVDHPVFSDLVGNVIYTDYVGGTVEWNMLMLDCPSGWIKVFTRQAEILDTEISTIRILSEFSMVRDCNFVLNDLVVLEEFALNDPACTNVPVAQTSWDSVKSQYR